MLVMGVDMGTTGSKAVIFDEDWKIISSAYREYDLCFSSQNRIELDFELVWAKIQEAIIEANSNIDSSRVGALAVSAIGDVIVPVDRHGTQVRNTIVDFDTRGTEEIKVFSQHFGTKKLFNITGMPPLFINSLSKILWFKKNEAEVFEKVERWATVEDYILQKMGMEPVASYSIAARTMLFDIRKKDWADEVLDSAGISRNRLAGVVPSGVVVGELENDIALNLGFKGTVKVCSGGHDMVCAAIGAGLTSNDNGTAVDIDGTIEGIVVAMDEANTSDIMLENLYPCYPGYDGYVTFSVNLTASCVLKWIKNEIYKDYEGLIDNNTNIYDTILQNVDSKNPGSILFIPQFSGSGNPYFDTNAKGMIYGLTLDATRGDIVKGLIEGLCYEIKMHLEGFENAGIRLKRLLCVGGGSRSKVKLQMKANITGLEMIAATTGEASALGAAALAAKAVGIVDNPYDVIKKVLSINRAIKPYENDGSNFIESFRRYKELNEIKHRFENL